MLNTECVFLLKSKKKMKKLIAICFTVSLIACAGEKAETKKEIDAPKEQSSVTKNSEEKLSLLNEIKEIETLPISHENQAKLAGKLSDFIQNFPNAPEKEALMLKVVSAYQGLAENSGSTQYYSKSVAYAQEALKEFPDLKDKEMILMIKASIEDFNLKLDEEAIKTYKMLIDLRPKDSAHVANYQYRIDNIDKGEYDFIK